MMGKLGTGHTQTLPGSTSPRALPLARRTATAAAPRHSTTLSKKRTLWKTRNEAHVLWERTHRRTDAHWGNSKQQQHQQWRGVSVPCQRGCARSRSSMDGGGACFSAPCNTAMRTGDREQEQAQRNHHSKCNTAQHQTQCVCPAAVGGPVSPLWRWGGTGSRRCLPAPRDGPQTGPQRASCQGRSAPPAATRVQKTTRVQRRPWRRGGAVLVLPGASIVCCGEGAGRGPFIPTHDMRMVYMSV